MINALFEMLIRRSRISPEPSDSSSSGGSGIPTDYVFYTPLSENLNDLSQYGRTLTATGTVEYKTVDNVPCVEIKNSGYLQSDDSSGITGGDHSMTLSVWLKLSAYPSGHSDIFSVGIPSSFKDFRLLMNVSKYWVTTWGFDWSCNAPASLNWAHLVGMYDSTEKRYSLYVDGELIATATSGTPLNIDASTYICLKAMYGGWPSIPNTAWYAAARIYDRTLTGEEIAALAAEFTPSMNIIFNSQSFTFISGIPMTSQLVATPSDCTFTTSDTLPAGVTLSSSGVLSYDGTTISQSSTASIVVTASKTGYINATATMTLNMTAASEGPTDYVFRAPLNEDINDVSTTARTGSETGGSVTVGTIKDGITCTYIPQSVRLLWPKGDVVVGSDTRTFCTWIYPSLSTSSWRTVMGMGQEAQYQVFGMGYRTSSNYAACGTYYNDLETSTALLNGWNHMAMVWDGSYIRLYLNGVQIGTKSGSSTTVNTASSDIAVGGRSFNTGDLCENAWFADARIYNRALSASEVAALATSINPDIDTSDSSSSSGGITPVIPTDYIRRYELTSNLKDSKHSTNTDYDLTKPSYASTSYGTEDGITGCKVTGTCIYNLTSTGLSTTNGYALSFWAKCASAPASSTNAKCMVNLSQYWSSSSIYWIGYVNGKWAGGVSSSSSLSQIRSDVAVDASWHCLTLNFDKTGQTISLWVDGVKAGELAGVSSLSISDKGVVLNAGAATQGTTTEAQPDVTVRYRDVTIFAKTLTEAEILGLAQEH